MRLSIKTIHAAEARRAVARGWSSLRLVLTLLLAFWAVLSIRMLYTRDEEIRALNAVIQSWRSVHESDQALIRQWRISYERAAISCK